MGDLHQQVTQARDTWLAERYAQWLSRPASRKNASAPKNQGPASAPPLPAELRAVIDRIVQRNTEINARFSAGFRSVSLEGLLLPQKLAAPSSIADGLHNVDAAVALLDQLMRERETAYAALEKDLDALSLMSDVSAVLLRGYREIAVSDFTRHIEDLENQYRILELYRRVLDFALARKDKITLESSKLVFADDADLEIFRTLARQVEAARVRYRAARSEAAQGAAPSKNP